MNLYVEYQHFKQEHLAFALDLIQKADFLTSIDLRDAYFSLSIHNDFKNYLRFSWNKHTNVYEFQGPCFGLASEACICFFSPQIGNKVYLLY